MNNVETIMHYSRKCIQIKFKLTVLLYLVTVRAAFLECNGILFKREDINFATKPNFQGL